MKQKLYCILLFYLLLSNTMVSYGISDNDVITIGGEINYPPYEFLDSDGEYRGFNIDLMKALALEMGIEIKFLPMDWVDAHVSLQKGSIDAISGMNYNESRMSLYDFSDEYLKNSLVCFVKKEEKEILSIDSLQGHRVAVQRSDSAAYALADRGEIELVFVSDLDLAFESLLQGEVDAVVGNKLTGLYVIQKNRNVNKIKVVGNDISYTSYGMAFKKGNDELRNKFNEALNDLKKKGTYYNIYEKWFGKEIKPAWLGLLKLLYTLSFIILIALVIVVLFIRLNSILKKEVEMRTTDITIANLELKQNQKTIRESDRYKEQIINGIGSGIITFDKDGIITTINKNCEKMLNLNIKNVLGKKYNDADLQSFINTDDLKQCIQDEVSFDFKEIKHFKNHDEIVLSYTLRPLIDLYNKSIGAIITFNDITEISKLRRQISENEKMESFGALISVISHEIRNPLTSIKAYIDLLPIKYDNLEFRNKITTQVPEEIARLNNLLTDLINYSKPKKLKKEKFDIIQLINNTIEIFVLELEAKNISINNLENNEQFIYADLHQIKQIIINIIRNSIDAIDDNGKIFIEVILKEEKLILSILDNGEGIKPEDLVNLYDPLYTTKETGTGLGLSICFQYAKDNQASINISSNFGSWTKVELILQMLNE